MYISELKNAQLCSLTYLCFIYLFIIKKNPLLLRNFVLLTLIPFRRKADVEQ